MKCGNHSQKTVKLNQPFGTAALTTPSVAPVSIQRWKFTWEKTNIGGIWFQVALKHTIVATNVPHSADDFQTCFCPLWARIFWRVVCTIENFIWLERFILFMRYLEHIKKLPTFVLLKAIALLKLVGSGFCNTIMECRAQKCLPFLSCFLLLFPSIWDFFIQSNRVFISYLLQLLPCETIVQFTRSIRIQF